MIFNLGIYADLKQLYAGRAEAMLQAFVEASAIYLERGIHPVTNNSTVMFFPTVREYDFFVEDMRQRNCPPNPDFIPTSSALKATIDDPVTVEKTVSDGKNDLFIALRIGHFEGDLRLIDRGDTPLLIMQAVEQSIEQILMRGVQHDSEFNAMVDGLRVEVSTLELNSTRIINKTLASRFFAPFDWFFDWIDKIFASGSGDEFNSMGETLLPETRLLIGRGVEMALSTALAGNITTHSEEIQASVRVLMEERANFLDRLEKIKGVKVLDDVHDGTYWTFDIGLNSQTFYNNRTFADVLKHTNAEITKQKAMR